MRKCAFCGTEMRPDDVICPRCGFHPSIPGATPPPPSPPKPSSEATIVGNECRPITPGRPSAPPRQAVAPPTPPAKNKPGRSKAPWIIAASTAALLGAGAACYFLFFNKSNKHAYDDPSSAPSAYSIEENPSTPAEEPEPGPVQVSYRVDQLSVPNHLIGRVGDMEQDFYLHNSLDIRYVADFNNDGIDEALVWIVNDDYNKARTSPYAFAYFDGSSFRLTDTFGKGYDVEIEDLGSRKGVKCSILDSYPHRTEYWTLDGYTPKRYRSDDISPVEGTDLIRLADNYINPIDVDGDGYFDSIVSVVRLDNNDDYAYAVISLSNGGYYTIYFNHRLGYTNSAGFTGFISGEDKYLPPSDYEYSETPPYYLND